MTDVLLVVVIAAVALFASAANSTNSASSSVSSRAIRKRRRRLQSSPTTPTTSTASKEATTTSTNDWPYHVDLELTFDNFPIDISWKFINIAHPSILLDGMPFGTYANDEYAGRTIVVPLAILTENDYHDDEEEKEKGALRQYKFIIYDQEGNGLCCANGNGSYALIYKNEIVGRGAEYGALDEIIFTIDPATYLDDAATTIDADATTTNADVTTSVVSPTVSTGSSSSSSSSSSTATTTTTAENNNSCQLCASNNKLYQLNERRVVLHQSVYTTCEAMADELSYNSSMEDEICIDSQRSLFADCCDVSTSIPLLTPASTTTNEGGGDGLATTIATSESNDASNTTTTTISKDDNNSTTASALLIKPDQNTWWCGISWDHVTSNCDSAVPCPGGDAVDCPAGQACFASTPCTHSPTYRPSVNPSGVPSVLPSSSPTRTPWGAETFVDFIYGDRDDTTTTTTNNNNNGGTNNYNSDVTLTDGGFVNSNSNNNDDDDDTDSKNVTSFSVDELKYHFFCGKSWTEADVTCDVHCPSGDKSDCPIGHDCYANTECDGRDTNTPSISPGPMTSSIVSTPSSGGEGTICTLCDAGEKLGSVVSISYKTQSTTCGNLDIMLGIESILSTSGTCSSVRNAYRQSCCQEQCQLCQTSSGVLLDLMKENAVRHGGYEATCQEIGSMLSDYSSGERMCADAKTQLADQCCYRQCSLCSTGTMSTEWYKTVIFQGLSTTCLGLDFLLRNERVSDGSYRCSELQNQYMSQCCRASATACVLCSSDKTIYKMHANKDVMEQSMRTTCAAVSDSLTRLDKSDQQCTQRKQALFGHCCELGNVVVLDNGSTNQGGVGSGSANTATGLNSGNIPVYLPSPEGVGVARYPTTKPTPKRGENPGSVKGPSTATNTPTTPYAWGLSDNNMSWVEIWDSKKNVPESCGVSFALSASIAAFVLSSLVFLFV